jgi:hypothetical protein
MARKDGKAVDTYDGQPAGDSRAPGKAVNKRLEDISWGVFLLMLGGIWLVPAERVPEGTWLIGVGLIWLGLNFARYMNGIRMSGFTLVLGTLAILSGIGDFMGAELPLLGIALILIGASILLKPMFERNRY